MCVEQVFRSDSALQAKLIAAKTDRIRAEAGECVGCIFVFFVGNLCAMCALVLCYECFEGSWITASLDASSIILRLHFTHTPPLYTVLHYLFTTQSASGCWS